MRGRYNSFINENVAIRRIELKDIDALLNAGFLYKSVLDSSLENGFSKLVGIIPQSIGLVACHIQEDDALGFLSLVEHTHWLYSIKFVFVNPHFRKLGIATSLINYAKSLAKERGARKVFLNANSNDNSLIQFYEKRGFGLIMDGSMVWGGGSSKKLQRENTNSMVSFKIRSVAMKDQAFGVYKNCMGKGWTDFFEINNGNIAKGFSRDFKMLYSKNVFLINPANSPVIVSKLPLLHNGITELYVPADADIPSVFAELSHILSKIGIAYTKLTVFNVIKSECFDLLKEMEFYPFQARILGLTL